MPSGFNSVDKSRVAFRNALSRAMASTPRTGFEENENRSALPESQRTTTRLRGLLVVRRGFRAINPAGRHSTARPSPEVLDQHQLISLAILPGVQEKLPVWRYAEEIEDRLFDRYYMFPHASGRPERLDVRLGRNLLWVQCAGDVI